MKTHTFYTNETDKSAKTLLVGFDEKKDMVMINDKHI